MSAQSSSGGMITVHSPQLCAEILGTAVADELQDKGSSSPMSSPQGQKRQSSPTRSPSRSSAAHIRAEDWLSQKARRAVVALPDDPDLVPIRDLCQQILEEERSFFSELNEFLSSQEDQEQCKRELLYRKWGERVFEPIHRRLAAQLDSPGYRALDGKKRKLFELYLHYRNRKEVFLDTISGAEYDPLSLSHSQETLKVTTGRLDDPLISQAVDYAAEQMVVRGCDEGLSPGKTPPPSPLGREDTDCVFWLAMQLVHIDSEARERSRQRMLGVRNCSHLDRVTWNEMEPSPELITRELQMPHKTPIRYQREGFRQEWREPST